MRLTRRELIATALGLPVALAGCTAEPVRPRTGALLGQNLDIGHRLRDGFRPRPTDAEWHSVSVVIVGGGVAGLAAARRLDLAGQPDYLVLELEDRPGGTARSGECPVSPFPWGAHYLPVPLPPNAELIELLLEMGVVESRDAEGSPVVGEQFLCRDPEERLFFEGTWIEGLYPSLGATSDDLSQWAAFRAAIDDWVGWRDRQGRRAFTIPIRDASDDPEVRKLDTLSMAEWLRQQGWTSPRLHWVVDYSCRDDYGLSAEQTSAWAGLLYFAGRLEAPGAEHQPLITWPEGNSRITTHLARRAGARLRCGTAVTQILPATEPDGAVEVIAVDVVTGVVRGYRARQVIFAAPRFLAGRLIEGFKPSGSPTDRFEYGSWIVANLQLRERPRESSFPLSWDNVIYDSRSLGYVVATHQAGKDYGPTVLTWYYALVDETPRAAREFLLKAGWEDLAELALTDLERAHPDIRDLTEQIDVYRWGHAMIQPRVGFLFSEARRQAHQPWGRIHFAHTDLSGIALLEEAFAHGNRAADEVLASFEMDSQK